MDTGEEKQNNNLSVYLEYYIKAGSSLLFSVSATLSKALYDCDLTATAQQNNQTLQTKQI